MSMLKSIFVACAVVMILGMTIETRAALLLIDDSGQLIGAEDVLIDGMLYDVQFVDGTCIDLFDGCDDETDFDFNDEVTALLAAQALLDQVYIDTAAGFDTDPALTFGCELELGNCSTLIPFAFENDGTPLSAVTVNSVLEEDDRAAFSRTPASSDFSLATTANFAFFTPTIVVPEPPSWLLLGVGLIGLAGIKLRLSMCS